MVKLPPKMAGKGFCNCSTGAARPSCKAPFRLFSSLWESPVLTEDCKDPIQGQSPVQSCIGDMQLADKLLLLAAASGTGILVYRVSWAVV